MKICTKCLLDKPLSEFNWKQKAKGLASAQCKDCTRSAIRDHFNRNKEYYREKGNRNRKRVGREVAQRVIDYLQAHPCVDCGEEDILVLEFDHVRGTKRDAVSVLMRGGRTWQIVADEIDKCDVRCANCHRRKTAIQFGSYKLGP